jgi:hypothetical protein
VDEKKIHKSFLNDPPPVDIPSPDVAWTNMQKKLDGEEKERRPIGWWYYPAAILFLTVTAWFFLPADFFTDRISVSKKGVTTDFVAKDNKVNKDVTAREAVPFEEGEAGNTNSLNESKPGTTINKPKKISAGDDINGKVLKQQKVRFKKLSASIIKPIATPAQLLLGLDTAKNNGISKSRISPGLIPGDSVNEIRAGVAKKEEVQPATGSKQEDIANNIIVEAGLQWNLPVPINGSNSYFAGPNGASQPYRLLFPGLWISLIDQKHMFTFQVNPFATAILSNKPYTTKSTISTAEVILESRTLNKIFGTSASLGYDYNIKKRWWAGGYTTGRFWHSATATAKEKKINSSNGNTSAEYINRYSFNDSDWTGFTKFQVAAGVQLLYKLPRWQAGIYFDYCLVPLIDEEGQKNQTTAQFFMRWQLYKQKR